MYLETKKCRESRSLHNNLSRKATLEAGLVGRGGVVENTAFLLAARQTKGEIETPTYQTTPRRRISTGNNQNAYLTCLLGGTPGDARTRGQLLNQHPRGRCRSRYTCISVQNITGKQCERWPLQPRRARKRTQTARMTGYSVHIIHVRVLVVDSLPCRRPP